MNHPKEQTLTEALNKVMPFVNYKGNIIERMVGAFRYQGKIYKTISELQKAIDDNCNSIDKSILK